MNFAIKQVNSPFDDSVFFIRNIYLKKSFLFDCGRINALQPSEILSLGNVFISHTHMDHFFGFDRVIRCSLSSENHINFYGPPGFINNIDGKFRSYTWNLTDNYKFSITVYELHPDGKIIKADFISYNKFTPEISEYSYDELSIGDNFKLDFEFLDHRTISVGYKVSEPINYSVNKDRLSLLGYLPDKWLAKLKKIITENENSGNIVNYNLDVPTKNGVIVKNAHDLYCELITVKPAQSVTYITDCSPSQENIDKAIKLAKDTDLLLIEAVFPDEDIDHAHNKKHLTIGAAKRIFLESNAKMVRFSHFSSRYENSKEKFIKELYEGISHNIYSDKDTWR